MMTKKRILLAEDHVILREGIASLLASLPDVEVVGEAEDGQQAVAKARDLQPDLVIIDLSMPLLNGTAAIGQIKRRRPETRIIVLTMHKSDEYVRAALDAGADGYLLKGDSQKELLAAMRSVFAGDTYLSPRICGTVVSGFLGHGAVAGSRGSRDALTDRERAVVKLVAEGYRNLEIAGHLSISVKTVEKHRTTAMRKLDLHTAAALTAYAIDNGLLVR
jgi:DNA-binding NarL/FixJ family response regulator